MKKIFPIVIAIVLVGFLLVVYLSANLVRQKKPQEIRSKAAPSTTLFLDPATTTKYPNQLFTTNIKVNTGANQIVSLDLVLNYNPAILEVTAITMGNFLANATEIQKTINNQTGKIIYSFYTVSANAKSGEGTLATISFKGKASGVSSVAFDPQSAIGAIGESQNVLANTVPASYTIQNDTTPPATVSNLGITNTTMQAITLTWSAPGDVGPAGKANSYDLRYSTSLINDSNWSAATPVANLPIPATPGTQETITIDNLTPNTNYFFGLKSKDANNNVSSLSNIASGKTLGRPSLNFQLKFQGIISQRPNQNVKIILKEAGVVKYTLTDVSTSANTNGVYTGAVADIDSGTYTAFVKGYSHLQKNMGNVILNPGVNNQNWSGTILKAGDIDGNNLVNAVDIARVIQDYFPDTPADSPADFNLDGTVNAVDIGFVIENYFQAGDQ